MLAKQQFEEISEEKRLNPVHGNIYQLKLLMLFLYRGVSKQYSFHLATEVKEAEKFDDLVFQYVEDSKIKYRLLQAKHKLDESKKITLDDLLGRNDNNYSLVKYFFSYRNAKKSKLFQDGIIEDVIICTNIGLDLPDLKRNGIEVKNIEGLDYILDIKNSASKRYSFNRGLISKLKPILDKNLKHGNLISDEEVQDFINHLVFAVNQPNEEELGKIIKNEIGEDLDLVTTENTYNKFFITMLNWLQGKERGKFLSYEEGKEFFEEAKRGLPILFNVRDPVSSFTGRIEQLDNLHKAMMNGGRAIVSQSVSISGLGGVGKSELARKYISQYSKDYDNKVIWINAESYSTLSESFRRLACDKLGISLKNRDGKEKDIKSIVEDVYRFFSKGKSLFIFDNAEKFKDDDGIDKFLPSLPENMNKPHILVTSRNTKWPKNVKICSLNTFTKAESVEFIKKALKMENSAQDEDIIKLAEKLQYFPLALQQAVAYIKVKNEELRNIGSGLRIKDYLETYERKTRELLNDSEFLDSDDNYTKATFTALKVQLDAIEKRENGNKAIEIINVIAYLAPKNISTKMFLGLQSNKEELGSAIGLLKQYSIVNVEQEQVVLNVHRLVQQVTRLELKETNKEEENVGKVFYLLRKNFPYKSESHEDLIKKRILLPHLEAFLLHLDGLSIRKIEVTQKIEELLELMYDGYNNLENPRRERELLERALAIRKKIYGREHFKVAIILGQLGNAYGDLGDHKKKKELLERALPILEQHYGRNHHEIARILVNLGNAYGHLGDHQRQKTLLEQGLAIKEKHYDPDHLELCVPLASLGNAYGDLGNHHKQKELLERALAIEERHSGPDHFRLVGMLVSLGSAYNALGNPHRHKRLIERALDIAEKHYGKEHSRVANALVHLGNAYHALGDHQKQKILLERALSIEEKHYGREHFQTANILVNLGNVYGALGDAQKQKTLLERGLVIFEKHYGPNHFQVATALGNLGTYYNSSNPDKAKQLLERALTIFEKHYGPNHFDVAIALQNLSEAYGTLGNLQKKRELLERALAIKKKHYGEGHLTVAQTSTNLGIAYYDTDPNKTKHLLEGALAIFERHYGSDHVTVANTLLNLGNTYGTLGNFQKKRALLERALAVKEKHHGSDHFEVATILVQLGNTYGHLGNPNKKKELLSRALPIQEKHYGRNHFEVAITLVNLGNAYFALDDPNRAKELIEQSLPILEKHYGREHFEVAIALVNLGNTYGALGDPNRAKELLEQALSIEEKHYGRNHFEVARTLVNLSTVYGALDDHNKKKELLERALSIQEKHYGRDHFEIAKTLENLGNTYGDLGDNHKQNELLERALSIFKRHYGKDHFEVARKLIILAYRNLDNCIRERELLQEALPILKRNNSPTIPVIEERLIQIEIEGNKEENNCRNLIQAAQDDDLEEVKYPFSSSKRLFENVKIGNNQQVILCLEKEKAIVNDRDNNGGTPLYWAIHNGHADTASILLNNGANPTLVTNKGNTPLHMASNKGNTQAIGILLDHVKNNHPDKLSKFINAQTILGGTSALHIASNIEVTRSLLQYGSVYNIKNKEGKIPLDLAKNDGIRKLLSFTNELFEGVKNGNRQIISKLRNLEVDDFIAVTNARNDQGHTLLQVAIANKHRDIATELSEMLKNPERAPSSSMESVNVAGPSRSYGNLPL